MNTIILIKWSSIALAVSILIAIGILIFMASYFIAELQKKKFTIQYEMLRGLINKSPLTMDNYQAIYDMFNETYCYSDGDIALIKHLWTEYKIKFRNIVPVNDKDLFSFPDIKKLTVKKSHTAYEKLNRKSNVELIKS